MTGDWWVQWWYDSGGRWDAVAPSRMSREDNDKHHAPQERSKMLYSSLLSISSPRLKYRHSTSPESPTIVHIGVWCRWINVLPDGCIDAVSIEMYRLTNTPALVTDAEIKSNEFDTIFGWKRCWHAWAKPTPASRFSHARQRFYRTIALLALHIPQTENKVLRSRSVGRSEGLDRQRKGKIPLFIPF